MEFGNLLDFGGKIYDRLADLRLPDEDAAARFLAWGAMDSLHARDDSTGQQPADVNHFVRLHVRSRIRCRPRAPVRCWTTKATVSVPLIFVGSTWRNRVDQRDGTKAIADRSAGVLWLVQFIILAIDDDGAEKVDACAANFGGGGCADVHVEVFDVARLRSDWIGRVADARKVRRRRRRSICRRGFDAHGLRGIEFVEDRGQAILRQALDAEVTVGGDFADDEAGLVDGSDDEAMRRAAADGDGDVAEIVGCGVQSFRLVRIFSASCFS